MMDERLATLLADLQRAEDLAGADLHRAARRASWVAEFTAAQFAELLIAIFQFTTTNWLIGWWDGREALEPRIRGALAVFLGGCRPA